MGQKVNMRRIGVVIVFFFLVGCFAFTSVNTAQAMTDHWYSPTCEAVFDNYSAASITRKSTELKYGSGKATLETSYQLHTNAATSLNFTLPVYGRLSEFPSSSISVALNGTVQEATIGYSKLNFFSLENDTLAEIIALREVVPAFNPETVIHEYSITASVATSFSFNLQSRDKMLYVFSSHTYQSQNRLYTVNLNANQTARLLIFGELLDLETTDTYTVNQSESTAGEYAASVINDYFALMSEGNDMGPLFRYRLSEFLAGDYGTKQESALIDSCFDTGYAFHDYSLSLNTGDSTLVITQPMNLGINGAYTPTVFVGKIIAPVSTAPFSFTVTTEEYILESTITLSNKKYTGDSVESITIALCSVEKPDTIGGNAKPLFPTWAIVVECLCGVALLGLGVLLIYILVRRKKTK